VSFCGTVQTARGSENKENDGEDVPRRYNLRRRKPVDRYQAPMESRLNAQFLLKPYFLHISEIKLLNANTCVCAHSSVSVLYLHSAHELHCFYQTRVSCAHCISLLFGVLSAMYP